MFFLFLLETLGAQPPVDQPKGRPRKRPLTPIEGVPTESMGTPDIGYEPTELHPAQLIIEQGGVPKVSEGKPTKPLRKEREREFGRVSPPRTEFKQELSATLVEKLHSALEAIQAWRVHLGATERTSHVESTIPFLEDRLLALQSTLERGDHARITHALQRLEGGPGVVGVLEDLPSAIALQKRELAQRARRAEAGSPKRDQEIIAALTEDGRFPPEALERVAQLLERDRSLTTAHQRDKLDIQIRLEEDILRETRIFVRAIKEHLGIPEAVKQAAA